MLNITYISDIQNDLENINKYTLNILLKRKLQNILTCPGTFHIFFLNLLGLVLWHSEFSHDLQHEHPISES